MNMLPIEVGKLLAEAYKKKAEPFDSAFSLEWVRIVVVKVKFAAAGQ